MRPRAADDLVGGNRKSMSLRRILLLLALATSGIDLGIVAMIYIIDSLSIGHPYWIDITMIVVWPTSILLLAAEYATPAGQLMILALAIATNVLLYAALGLIAWSVVTITRRWI